MSVIVFMTNAFDINVSVPNSIQYIQKIFLTNSGDNISVTGIILDGTTNGGITIANLTGRGILGTNSSGKIIVWTYTESDPKVWTLTAGQRCYASGGQVVCNQTPPGWAWAETDPIWSAASVNYVQQTQTWNRNTAYGRGNHAGAWYLTAESDPIWSAASVNYVQKTQTWNRNTAYTWTTTSWATLWGWYNTIGINVNSLATATLNCDIGEIIKSSGVDTWICATDQTAIPAGNDTEIQFKSGSTFGAESTFVRNTKDQRLWVWTWSPAYTLDVFGAIKGADYYSNKDRMWITSYATIAPSTWILLCMAMENGLMVDFEIKSSLSGGVELAAKCLGPRGELAAQYAWGSHKIIYTVSSCVPDRECE